MLKLVLLAIEIIGVLWVFMDHLPRWAGAHLGPCYVDWLMSSLPWVCVGDFNEILLQSEKEGGPARPMGQIMAFREALADCSLLDLGYSGNPYT